MTSVQTCGERSESIAAIVAESERLVAAHKAALEALAQSYGWPQTK